MTQKIATIRTMYEQVASECEVSELLPLCNELFEPMAKLHTKQNKQKKLLACHEIW